MRKISKRDTSNISTAWKGKFIEARTMKDPYYEFLHDGTGKFVAVLGYRRIGKDAWEYLGRIEKTPPHQDGFALASLTGGVESDEKPLDAAVRELREESGIIVKPEQMKELGVIRPSKASDSFGYLFGVDLGDVPDKDKYAGEGDGTDGEIGAYCEWISYREAINSKDPILISMAAKLGFGC